ncbi:Uncharacterized protein DAT39_007753 [Clarias magur]|uniref:Uncharacterized protein n=1 Tax=Clarias magur TaxID=1594786 RepID=A0A8J4UB84_CLAMG|nr:Uncharacterized protein DAT39_007753 [Clarias magur]
MESLHVIQNTGKLFLLTAPGSLIVQSFTCPPCVRVCFFPPRKYRPVCGVTTLISTEGAAGADLFPFADTECWEIGQEKERKRFRSGSAALPHRCVQTCVCSDCSSANQQRAET